MRYVSLISKRQTGSVFSSKDEMEYGVTVVTRRYWELELIISIRKVKVRITFNWNPKIFETITTNTKTHENNHTYATKSFSFFAALPVSLSVARSTNN